MVDKKPKVVGVKKPKVKESKQDTFKRIVEPRVRAILSRIRIFGNCANRNNYEYTIEQIKKISLTLTEALTETLAMFKKSKKEQEAFTL